mmetsp:Transcript_40197/g.67031  ORF Transcript_40197/g.67031 Transcript_40197/m.67031 type:complete len:82 (+) Transcript_40197:42-287(+)
MCVFVCVLDQFHLPCKPGAFCFEPKHCVPVVHSARLLPPSEQFVRGITYCETELARKSTNVSMLVPLQQRRLKSYFPSNNL